MVQGYRPAQWVNGVGSSLTIVSPANVRANAANAATPNSITVYVFDGVPRLEHEQELVATLNPVQTGANITDHAYTMPARLTVEILMSDSMQSYIAGQFSGGTQSRSVNAYQTLLLLQQQKLLLGVNTRLRNYTNMLIVSIKPDESVDTAYALKCHVTFQEVFLVSLASNNSGNAVSSQPQTTQSTQIGTMSTSLPTTAQIQAFGLSGLLFPPTLQLNQAAAVPGAGAASSTPIAGWETQTSP